MTETKRSLLRTPLATVTPERQRWAVTDQIPLGVLTLMAGTAGIAKSTVLAHYVAEWTRGTAEGDLCGQVTPVAMIAAEDDLAKVLVPRLTVAGADLDQIEVLGGVQVTDERGDWVTTPTLKEDLPAIRQALEESGARVLIIDPIVTLMGGDSHRLEDVRRNLDPLAALASDLDIAVVCVAHFNKGAGRAGEKVSGSHAFRDIARSLLLLAEDEETGDRILTVEKSNYSTVKPSLAFRVDSVDVPIPGDEPTRVGRAVLLGASSLTVQDILKRDDTVLSDDMNELLRVVQANPDGITADDVAEALDMAPNKARSYLSRAVSSGRIERVRRGMYAPRRNTFATPPKTVASVASDANSPSIGSNATLATDAPLSAGVAFGVATHGTSDDATSPEASTLDAAPTGPPLIYCAHGVAVGEGFHCAEGCREAVS